jgi:hypothetical protein
MIILRSNKTSDDTINLEFRGYFKEKDLPPSDLDCSGIYVVYAGRMIFENRCELCRLLYIGESENVATRPGKNHENYEDWKDQLKKGEILYFSFAKISSKLRERTEAALIYVKKPVCNEKGKESFNFENTTIKTSGRNAFLIGKIIANPTDE